MDDITAIQQLKYRYIRAIDTKAWEVLAGTLTEDAIGNYGEEGHQGGRITLATRDSLVEFMRSSLDSSIVTDHLVNHPVITVAGDEASGSWYLQDRVIMSESNMMLIGAAYYTDCYRRTSEGWKISSTGFDRTYEATVNLGDVPSFVMKKGAALRL
ncbi:nuclear transport factor 2 family protein [Tomitella biformata]|uniref:nuclear transport factor 2 family protein n=1 Tax=Tomitella biformata TaxID=630403 RepID=UPI0004663050|nr:nuclear transport factor 2 family protein [Tomitella biformata]